MCACDDNLFVNEPICEKEFENKLDAPNIYAISEETALANLFSFLAENDEINTRTTESPTIKTITPIKFKSVISRELQDTTDLNCENLLYVVNFEDEQGYAILSGDTRIKEEIIAIGDEGELSDITVHNALDLLNTERPIYDGYPITGPGFFKEPEYGDELLMNPNTVRLYIEAENDTLVGNFSVNEDEYNTPETVVTSMCVSYAFNQINNYDELDSYQMPSDELIGNDGKRTSITKSAWRINRYASPILFNYRYWYQGDPFNYLYPERRKWIIVGHKEKAPAGCFPLAIAKILTYFKYPQTYIHNGHTIDWEELNNPTYIIPRDTISISHLLYKISEGCGSWYFQQGTFTLPSKATSYMRAIGLKNSHSYIYKFNKVVDMIDNGCPLIIYSIPNVRIDLSHSWNIDGYKIKERTITKSIYEGNTLLSSTTEIEICNMVHCDFGWTGRSNGYYVSGIFKVNDYSAELDNPYYKIDKNTHYNNYIRIVTYDKPI